MSAETPEAPEARVLADLLKGKPIKSEDAKRYGVEAIGPVVHRLRKLGTRITVAVGKSRPNAPLACEWRIRPEHLREARAKASTADQTPGA
jgi:hypothetical protein